MYVSHLIWTSQLYIIHLIYVYVTVVHHSPYMDMTVVPNSPYMDVTVVHHSPYMDMTVVPNSPYMTVTVVRTLFILYGCHFCLILLSNVLLYSVDIAVVVDPFISRLPLQPYFESEHRFMSALTQYAKSQHLQSLACIINTSEEEETVFDLDSSRSFLIKGLPPEQLQKFQVDLKILQKMCVLLVIIVNGFTFEYLVLSK